MHLQQHRGVGADGALVVDGMRLVRGAHLHHARLRQLHDVGHAERSADLHQLAARHHGFVPARELVEHHHDRRRVVVHGQRRLGAGERADEALHMVVAAAARHGIGVVLQRGVARATSLTALTASSASGLRPRFVCTTMPVALITRRSDGCARASARARVDSASVGTSTCSRAPASTARRGPRRRPRGRSRQRSGETGAAQPARAPGTKSSSSTCGRERRRARWFVSVMEGLVQRTVRCVITGGRRPRAASQKRTIRRKRRRHATAIITRPPGSRTRNACVAARMGASRTPDSLPGTFRLLPCPGRHPTPPALPPASIRKGMRLLPVRRPDARDPRPPHVRCPDARGPRLVAEAHGSARSACMRRPRAPRAAPAPR